MTPIDDKQLAEMEARMQAATPGPWKTLGHGYPLPGFQWWTVIGHSREISRVHSTKKDDAEFIAHAREDIEALIASLRSALATNTSLAEEVLRYQDKIVEYGQEISVWSNSAKTQRARIRELEGPLRVCHSVIVSSIDTIKNYLPSASVFLEAFELAAKEAKKVLDK